jgi:hypothetical protein
VYLLDIGTLFPHKYHPHAAITAKTNFVLQVTAGLERFSATESCFRKYNNVRREIKA